MSLPGMSTGGRCTVPSLRLTILGFAYTCRTKIMNYAGDRRVDAIHPRRNIAS